MEKEKEHVEKENDAELIRKVLSGDEAAFNSLLRKHHKSVHALAWREVGDFHFAEEIAQDVFFEVYKRLPTLKDHNRFAGWLYVITKRCCINWHRKNRSHTQSLEDTPAGKIDNWSYENYLSEQREAQTAEHNRAIVKALLNKLPESERTVVTLYYLSDMTTKEISNFLGVSVNTITSRLRRARKRLADQEELLVSEILGSVQLPADLIENIMRQIADLEPSSPVTGKPLLPWAAFGIATFLTLLLLGGSHQYLARFQKPYSFEAKSNPTVEIIDAPVRLDTDAKPSLRNQTGRVNIPSENSSTGTQASKALLTSTAGQNPLRYATAPWRQASGPQGTPIFDTFATSQGTLYIATQTGIYTVAADAPAWTPLNTDIPTPGGYMSMTEYDGTLYIVSADVIFTSSDNGETWNTFCPRPNGTYPVGLIITGASQTTGPRTRMTMYLAFRDKGIFRSTDAGNQWHPFTEGLTGKRIYEIASIGNAVFAGTNEGLYRLNTDFWERVPVETFKTTQSPEDKALTDTDSGFYRLNPEGWELVPVEFPNAIHFLKASGKNLYVGMGPDLSMWRSPETKTGVIVSQNSVRGSIFHSADLGRSWTEITPKNGDFFFRPVTDTEFWGVGETLIAHGTERFRSQDAGKTWTQLEVDTRRLTGLNTRDIGVNERTFYTVGTLGIYRTLDAGDSWQPFMDGIIGTRIRSLVAFNNRLYAAADSAVIQSTDDGDSWKSVKIDSNPPSKAPPHAYLPANTKLIVADGALYEIGNEAENLRISRLSTDGRTLAPVQGMPTFDTEMLPTELWKSMAAAKRFSLPDDKETDPRLTEALRNAVNWTTTGGFAVSDGTFYVEYQRALFKWKIGDSAWTYTGLIDLTERSNRWSGRKGFRVAASGKTLYVGKRDGKLFQSLDAGDHWRDITPNLSLHFTRFNEIVFGGSAVYVSTDKGTLTSQDDEHWRVLTDGAEQPVVIDSLATAYTAVYGAGDTGIYRLDTRGKWQQMFPKVPGKVTALVISNDKLYIATERSGMFHIPLEAELPKTSLLP